MGIMTLVSSRCVSGPDWDDATIFLDMVMKHRACAG